jgi:hypothetical protein
MTHKNSCVVSRFVCCRENILRDQKEQISNEAVSSKYYERASAFVAYLPGTQSTYFLRRIILSYVTFLALPHFSKLSHERLDFSKRGGGRIESEIMFRFSLQLLSKTLLISRKIQRDIIINVHRSSCKVSVILANFN